MSTPVKMKRIQLAVPISVYLVVAGKWVADKKCNFELGVPII